MTGVNHIPAWVEAVEAKEVQPVEGNDGTFWISVKNQSR